MQAGLLKRAHFRRTALKQIIQKHWRQLLMPLFSIR